MCAQVSVFADMSQSVPRYVYVLMCVNTCLCRRMNVLKRLGLGQRDSLTVLYMSMVECMGLGVFEYVDCAYVGTCLCV